ncbi:hypothetical protein [Yersinia hibernica]|uniref:Type III secretion system protein n=1 Tax=Yersinia enterocolitica LC20 TaxID=1443113 RepID=A0A7U4GDW7_YEREN|nr:hypothetical protein [Yersinia hibernica]AHM72775.1 type III secretion system protein [Yersinia hibernica]OVZ78290.1 hypothetical protein CBW54_20965 [Yersinia kristensenii]
MTNISSISNPSLPALDSEPAEESFNDKVLHYFQQNKPQGKLSELMDKMRALSPDKTVSMHQLNEALLYSDTYLRHTEEYKEYTDEVLDKHTFRLLGVNMFFDNMMYKSFTKSDDDTSL